MNMVIAFYAATFPGIVEDLPEVKASEQDVMTGAREYVKHMMPKHNRLLIPPDPRSTISCCPINVPSSTTCSTLLDHRSKSSRPPSPWVLLSPSVTALTLNFSTRTRSSWVFCRPAPSSSRSHSSSPKSTDLDSSCPPDPLGTRLDLSTCCCATANELY